MKGGMSNRFEKSQQLSTLKSEVSTLKAATEREGFSRAGNDAMKILFGGLSAALLTMLVGSRALGAAASCDSLASMALPQTTITLASVVEAGAFTPPGSAEQEAERARTARGANPSGPAGQVFRGLPAFCRVAATIKPSSDSDIKVEVWLPLAGWNGKFQAVGNGGWAGTITYAAMASALQRGYATASTDTGHASAGGDGSFTLNHPEKVVDFAYRAVHEMTVQAKAIVEKHYGSGPR